VPQRTALIGTGGSSLNSRSTSDGLASKKARTRSSF
jgi:hypothetical protein